MKVFIIILHFGNPKVTEVCLKSIIEHEKGYEEIILVDNNSEFRIQNSELKKGIKILTNKKNLGYAGGVNAGIKYALFKNADYILLLNNDVVLKKEIISKLVKFLSTEEKVGIVAPAIEFIRKGIKTYDLGGKVHMLLGRTSHNEVIKITDDSPRLVDYVSGCCMLIKREVFEKIGLFDERFFLYYEDVDFCLRARKAGFQIAVLPSIAINHKLSKSAGKESVLAIYQQTRSALLFGRKHFSGWQKVFNRGFILFQSAVFVIKKFPTGFVSFKALYELISKK